MHYQGAASISFHYLPRGAVDAAAAADVGHAARIGHCRLGVRTTSVSGRRRSIHPLQSVSLASEHSKRRSPATSAHDVRCSRRRKLASRHGREICRAASPDQGSSQIMRATKLYVPPYLQKDTKVPPALAAFFQTSADVISGLCSRLFPTTSMQLDPARVTESLLRFSLSSARIMLQHLARFIVKFKVAGLVVQ